MGIQLHSLSAGPVELWAEQRTTEAGLSSAPLGTVPPDGGAAIPSLTALVWWKRGSKCTGMESTYKPCRQPDTNSRRLGHLGGAGRATSKHQWDAGQYWEGRPCGVSQDTWPVRVGERRAG